MLLHTSRQQLGRKSQSPPHHKHPKQYLHRRKEASVRLNKRKRIFPFSSRSVCFTAMDFSTTQSLSFLAHEFSLLEDMLYSKSDLAGTFALVQTEINRKLVAKITGRSR